MCLVVQKFVPDRDYEDAGSFLTPPQYTRAVRKAYQLN
jgi:hypothetical protein